MEGAVPAPTALDINVFWELIGVLLLVAGNAFFVGSEIALTSARRSRIKQLADMGNKNAKIVQLLHNEPERFYSVTQIGITVVSMGLGAIGIVTMTKIFDPVFEYASHWFGEGHAIVHIAHTMAYIFGFIIISYLHVVGGELAPKVLAFHKAEKLSLAVAWTVNMLYRSLSWMIWIMNKSSNALLWIFGQRDLAGHGEGHFSMSEEEIRTILSASEKEGVLNPEETKMIRGVFDLDEHSVREAMIPRTEIIALSANASIGEAVMLFRDSRHARYPVFENNLDHIVGVVVIKELLSKIADSKDDPEILNNRVGEIMRPPHIIPESKSLSQLLKEFKRQRQQMAVVVDEYGGTAGVITLEDILEEIVGEYADEFTRQHRHIKKLEGSQYVIDAAIRLSDLEVAVNFPFPEGDYVTLAGLVYHQLGRIPKVGDKVELESARLKVLEMDNHRITKVLFQDTAVAEDGSIQLSDMSSPPSSEQAAREQELKEAERIASAVYDGSEIKLEDETIKPQTPEVAEAVAPTPEPLETATAEAETAKPVTA